MSQNLCVVKLHLHSRASQDQIGKSIVLGYVELVG